ncbi:phospholipase-like protein [Tanacetum coccineum]
MADSLYRNNHVDRAGVLRVLVTCRSRQIEVLGDENDVVPLKYHIVDNFEIQFGREEFCLVTGLKFGVEYWGDYNDEDEPIPFRRRVFSSSLDGKPIKGNTVLQVIKSKMFDQLHDDDAVSLCCVGILQLVLLGVEDRRAVPDWILRLANDRDGWDKYPWGSYVWPTLYSQLKNANVKRWPSLYATQPIDEVDKKTYLIFGFTWAFKTWILESFRGRAEEYYTHHKCHPRVVSWSSDGRFFRDMVFNFFHGHLPAERLTPDEIEARSGWVVRLLSRYRQIALFEVGQAGPSYGYNIATPTNWQTPMASQFGTSNLQRQMPSRSATPFWQNPLPSRINMMMPCSTRQSPYMDLPPTTVLPKKRGGKSKNKGKKANVSPFNLGNAFNDEDLEGDDVIITGEQDTCIYFTYENVDPNKVTRDEYIDCMNFILTPYDVYLHCHTMGYKVPSFSWRQLLPHLCMADSHILEPTYLDGWLSQDITHGCMDSAIN